MFLAGHGEWLGGHARLPKGFPADDPVSRVPLIVRWPGHTTDGHVAESVVEALDIVPNLLEPCGVPNAARASGRLPDAHASQCSARSARGSITEHDDWTSIRSAATTISSPPVVTRCSGDPSADPAEYEDVATEAAQSGELARHRGPLQARLLRARRNLPRTWPNRLRRWGHRGAGPKPSTTSRPES